MKVSTKGRYALRLMIDLATHDSGDWIALKDISKRQGISVKYLEQIVNPLSKTGYLLSARGPHGGYKLAKTPEEYSAGDILRAIEGSLAPIACLDSPENQCERYSVCQTITFWEGLDKVVSEYVDSVSLQQLADQAKPGDSWDFSI